MKAKTANKEMQKYKIEISILSALILLFISSLCFSESVRFFGKEHPGILIVAISVACEVVCDFRAEKNLLERIKIFFGICLVVGLLLEIVEAAKSDIQVEQLRASNLVLQTNVDSLNGAVLQLAHQYDLSTNALAEANERLKTIKPMKERLIDCLNLIDPRIIPGLKSGQPVYVKETVLPYLYNQIQALANEPGIDRYMVFRPDSSGGMILEAGRGQVNRLDVDLNPSLVRP